MIDFQFHRGPVRPLTTEVVDFFADGMAPSDHRPVVTTYQLDAVTNQAAVRPEKSIVLQPGAGAATSAPVGAVVPRVLATL